MKNASQGMPRARPALNAAAALGASLAVSAMMAVAHAGPMPKEAGVWFDDTGKGAVKIEPCGAKLCGRIVWLKDLVNDKGQPLIDRHNPDASLKTRPICGLQILGQLDQLPEGGFDNGWIYDPKEGKSYSLALKLSGPDELSVTGYKGVKFLSKTFIWKRAKTELPSCAAAPIEAKATDSKSSGGDSAPAAAAGAAAAGAAAKAAPTKANAAPSAPVAASAKASAPASAPAAPATKSSKAGTAEALPWSSGAAKPAAPAAKAQPQGASNLGAANVGAANLTPPKTAVKSPVTKTTVTKPAVAKPAAAKLPAATPSAVKAKPAVVAPVE